MGTYVTPAGLQIPSLQDLLAKLSTEQRAEIDALLDTDPDSPVGNLNGIFSSHIREAWEVLQIAFHGMDPDQAEAALLDFIAAITGSKREKATPSKFIGTRKLDLTLLANSTVLAGSVARVSGAPLIRFVLTEDVVSTLAGVYKGAAQCEQTGPIACNANTLTEIATPVVGWQAVNNPFDAIIGKNQDLDPELRLRREQELRATGSTNPDSLAADLISLEIDGDKPVLSVKVFFNDQDSISPQGLPGHSIEALIFDGLAASVPNDTLAQIIWDGKAGGIQAVGTTSGIATDSEGDKQTIKFSRPTIVDVAFQFTLEVDLDTYAGNAAAKAAIQATFLKKTNLGGVIRCNDYTGALMALSGVIDIPSGIQITINGDPFPPAGTNLVLGTRQMGNTQSSWIAVSTV